MIAIEDITAQVLENCDIADSQHAGLFSICGLSLRLRDLYKWEKGLDPWIEKDSAEILDWIGDKEQQWDELTEKDFKDIKSLGNKYDPFDPGGINDLLEPNGFFYGSGYARTVKDLLADTSDYGPLRYIIQHRKTTSLAFYVAFIESLTKELFPEIIDAFGEFTQTLNWDVIAQATADGYSTANYHADTICDIFQKGKKKNNKKWIENEIAIRLLKPLGVT